MAFKGVTQRWRKMVARNVYAINKFFIGGTAAANEVTLTATQLNKANRQAVAVRLSAVAAGDMPSTASVLTAQNAASLQKAYYIPDGAFSTASDAFGINLINAGTSGAGTATIASLDFSTAVANLVAFAPRDFGALTNASLSAAGAVTAEVVKKGSAGATSIAGVVILEFTV